MTLTLRMHTPTLTSNGFISPLDMTFDFELTGSPQPPSPFSPGHKTRDDVDDRAVSREGLGIGKARAGEGIGNGHGGVGSEVFNAEGQKPGPPDDLDDFARVVEQSLSRPTTAGSDMRPQTAGSSSHNGTPQFHPSLFPHKPAVSESAPGSPMSRSFIDSRDKPYGPSRTSRPPMMMLANNSSPSILRPESSGGALRSPPLPYHPRVSPKISPQDHFPGTNYSGSTARPSTRASSGSNITTIGTPYQATSSTFPLPQHVQTRPNNDNTAAMVAGVKVPTHHTSAAPKAAGKTASKAASKPASKPETKPAAKQTESKRKTRLLNPLTLLQRRKSIHPTDDEERAQREAQAQALARQRDVVVSGVNKPPPGFDPRIKGKKVHDFSAPRGKRNTFDETELPSPPPHGVHSPMSPALTSPMSPMSPNGFPPRTASLVNRGPRRDQSETPERRSTHTPVFVEHLGENPEAERRISSIDAENLENKDFLQRASKQSAATSTSQESTILPPFARRSQVLDPLQASFYRDDDSKRSSDPSTTDKEQDTSLSSMGEISPITARSSAQTFGAVSPSDGGKGSRPVSRIPSNGQSTRSTQLQTPTLIEQGRRSPSEAARTNNYWVVLAPPTVETIDEGHVNSISERPSPGLYHSKGPQFASQGISIRQPGSTSQSPTGRALSPATQSRLEKSSSPSPATTPEVQSPGSSKKLVEKRASAVGHAKRAASGTPKKHASNASRFSFQLGESAAQEHALEEKHRKIVSGSGPSQPVGRAQSPDEDEDEDDYFDEDAMDDMDEMEMQSGRTDDDDQDAAPQGSLYLHQARQALHVPESDDGSMYDEDIPEVTDERDVPYADHPAFRAHPAMDHHFAHNSMLPGSSDDYPYDGYWRDSTLDSYMRDSYYSSPNSQHSRMQSRGSRITVDTGSPLNQTSSAPSFQDYLSANDGTNRLSMPRSSLHQSATSSPSKLVRPPLPARDSGNSERNRVASGIAFNSNAPTPSSEKSQWIGSDHHVRDMSFSTVSEAQSSTAADRTHSGGAPSNFYMQPRAAIASPDVASTPRPAQFDFDTHEQDRGEEQPTKTRLNQEALAGLENDVSSLKGQTPILASPKSAKRVGSDGRRNISVGGVSLASPKSAFSGKSAGSESFEAFAETGGLSRVGSPQAGHHIMDAPLRNSNVGQQQQHAAQSGESVKAANGPNGLGLNSFSEFDFDQPKPASATTEHDRRTSEIDAHVSDANKKQEQKARFSLFPHQTNAGSRPGSRGTQKDTNSLHLTMPQSNRTTTSHYSGFSDASHSTAVPGSTANYSPVRASAMPSFQFPRASDVFDDSKDDMYFDDGNFEQDVNAPHQAAFNEDAFDDDAFLARPGMNMAHRRDISSGAYSAASLGSDGPYPTFATPNAAKARQRESQLMLEDLVLQEPVDPRLIPQRNPSEDAKRLGKSDRAPPLPIESSTSKEEIVHMQRTLDTYHAALANAANKAAADGRFWRAPSTASGRSASIMSKVGDAKSTYSWDEQSVSSNVEEGVEETLPSAMPEPKSLKSLPRQSGMAFDFGFDESAIDDVNDYDYDNDDDLVAAANAEALASDDEGFYGQEFAFYGRPRANSNEFNPTIGGYFGEDGDDGLTRNKSLREPNLTPITERSEFSTRNSVVGLGLGVGGQSLYGPPSAGLYGAQSPALARMSVTPLMESEMSFDELRKLRGQAFGGGSSRSLKSNSARSSAQSLEGPMVQGQNGRPGMSNGQQNAGTAFSFPSRTESSDSSNPPNVTAPVIGQDYLESPRSATSSQGNPFSMDLDATPRKNSQPTLDPSTAKKLPRESLTSQYSDNVPSPHSRKGSAADSVTYVKEPDPGNGGKPRWVMERRRTSEQGQLQLIGRELVQGGWI